MKKEPIIKQQRFKYKTSRKINGFLFVLPWLIGFLLFFLLPLWDTIFYAFNRVEVAPEGGIQFTFTGFQNFTNLFLVEVSTLAQPMARVFFEENMAVLINLPMIIFFSLFMAILANAKYPGRGVVRVIFFLPIILGLQLITDWAAESAGRSMIEVATGQVGGFLGITRLLYNYTFLPLDLILFIQTVVSNIFALITRTGVQTMIFLAGLQSIDPAYYEVAELEGANTYEMFWKVTLPSLASISVFVIVYTLVDLFLGSAIATEVYSFAFLRSAIGIGSALSVVYMLNVLLTLGIVFFIMNKAGILDRRG